MAAGLYYCTISAINYASGTASVTIREQEDMVVTNVPFLSMFYEMPNPGDTVAAIIDKTDGKLGRGVILGKIFAGGNKPGKNGKGIFYKEFSDGESVTYDPSDHSIEITAKKLVVKGIEYQTATQKG